MVSISFLMLLSVNEWRTRFKDTWKGVSWYFGNVYLTNPRRLFLALVLLAFSALAFKSPEVSSELAILPHVIPGLSTAGTWSCDRR